MDYNKSLESELAHLARLALSGRRQDIEMYIRRLAGSGKAVSVELRSKLNHLLQLSPTRQSPLRNENVAAIPVDRDSRLQLIRSEDPPVIQVEPIWPTDIQSKLNQFVLERKQQEKLLEKGIQPSRSLLFVGKPGLGKTLAARWLAVQLNIPLLILDLSAVISSFLGRTGVNLRNVIDYAKGVDAILLLDEFDAIAKKRDDNVELGELKRLVTVLLQEIDDWPSNRILIAATNHPDLLDPAVWRRFDKVIEFTLPNENLVLKAIEQFLGNEPGIKSEWIDILKIFFAGASFSDIEKSLMGLRRESIVHQKAFEDALTNYIQSNMESHERDERIKIAKQLVNMGHSQRRVHEWTGVSRDTIRKAK